MTKDPVCGMDVDEKSPPGGPSQYEGTTYGFCGASCKRSVDRAPVNHAKK